VATHGFFLGTACEEAGDGKRAIDVVPAPARKATLVAEELALVQSGLAFAGANRAVPAADGEDGILTAEEVAAMDLRGVEWMVLSGCDTGVGRIRSGEGVLGMRRAFQVAGAGAIVMSLWPVDDAATRQWMQVLYRARYRDGSSSTDAVRSADAAILRDRRAHQQSVHPFYWAGFVVSGSWR
jgi:CHAT domain-containing protein